VRALYYELVQRDVLKKHDEVEAHRWQEGTPT
jgi:hypothetical protein